MKRFILFCFALFTLAILSSPCSAEFSSPLTSPESREPLVPKEGPLSPGKCLTRAEEELGRLLNKLREEHQLPPLPIKEPLYRVAKWHVIDLETNRPHEKTQEMPCSLHSWSDKGKELGGGWAPVCYTPDHKQAPGIWIKPREIANHRSNGYESIYSTSGKISPEKVISFWKSKHDELNMILEQKNWGRFNWQTMGVGIHGRYAAVWFSEKEDRGSEMSPCSQTEK